MAKNDEAKISNEHVTEPGALRERITQRAYELYEQRDRAAGFDTQDWLQAEQEILGQTGQAAEPADDESGEGGGQAKLGAKAAKQT